MNQSSSLASEEFARHVLDRLKHAGYQAYWAGGCVRDLLLGRTPQDFDVATNATPPQVRDLFGHRRTLTVGQSFGVVIVLGRPKGVTVEVATFRKDSAYSDGRHPDSIEFSTPDQDAARRDFTINGLFYDPATGQVIDYVGGQEDLQRRVVRAIGNPHDRFAEDKLRILRALRFATVLDFTIEQQTWQAICQSPHEIKAVSPERVTTELRKLLLSPHRAVGLQLLHDSGLLHQLLPEVDYGDPSVLQSAIAELALLQYPDFAIVLALLMRRSSDNPDVAIEQAEQVGRRWRLTNEEIKTACWLLANQATILAAHQTPWPEVQPLLIAAATPLLLEFAATICRAHQIDPQGIEFCRERLAWPAARLNPTPLIDGHQLAALGIQPGPSYRRILHEVRSAQLLGDITTKHEARDLAKRLATEH